jgi:hypothetical protein
MKKALITLAAAAVATAALAAVTFDPTTGTGFVGKGDVQLAFGWNNAQLQRNASGITFTYNVQDTYDAECYWETTTGRGTIIVHDIVVPKHVSVNANIAYDARVRTQITGFNLNGFGTVVTDGTVPVVGGACPGNNPGTVTNVTLTSSQGGLYVNYGGTGVYLPPTPPATTTL